MTDSNAVSRCGYVAIVGRPNVGKSTLMNHLLGQKISITSRKPQTTRHRVLGIKTEGSVQAIYVDTPGIHQQEPKAINRMMNRAATGSVKDVDVIVMVVDGTKWNEGDEHVLHKLQSNPTPVILAINKVDTLENKNDLLPYIEEVSAKRDFAAIIPISALRNRQLDQLEEEIFQRLPEDEERVVHDRTRQARIGVRRDRQGGDGVARGLKEAEGRRQQLRVGELERVVHVGVLVERQENARAGQSDPRRRPADRPEGQVDGSRVLGARVQHQSLRSSLRDGER